MNDKILNAYFKKIEDKINELEKRLGKLEINSNKDGLTNDNLNDIMKDGITNTLMSSDKSVMISRNGKKIESENDLKPKPTQTKQVIKQIPIKPVVKPIKPRKKTINERLIDHFKEKKK